MTDIIRFIADTNHHFLTRTGDYLYICAISTVLAIIIGVVVGVAVSRSAIAGFFAVNLSGLLRAIPVLAFLIAVVPIFGVGTTPTLVALVVLGIPPILLNTYTGLRGIDPAIIDAAR